MRLIRLTTDSDNIFENDFSDEIVVEPNGQVALINASLKLAEHEIIINAENDLIQYQLTAGEGLRDVRLMHATYGSPNYDDESDYNIPAAVLLSNITADLNHSVGALQEDYNYIPQEKSGFAGIETGLQWKAELNKSSNKVSINYKNANRKVRVADFKKVNVTNTFAGSDNQLLALHHYEPATNLVSSTSSPEEPLLDENGDVVVDENGDIVYITSDPSSSFVNTSATKDYGVQYSDKPFCSGGGQGLMRLHEFTGSAGPLVPHPNDGFYRQGFCIGLSDVKPSLTNIVLEDIRFGVQVFQDNNADTHPLIASVVDGYADYDSARASFLTLGADSPHFYSYTAPVAGVTDDRNTWFGFVRSLGVLYLISYTEYGVYPQEERVIATFNLKSLEHKNKEYYPVMYYFSPATAGSDPNNNGATVMGNVAGSYNYITLDPFQLSIPYEDSSSSDEPLLGLQPPLQRLGQSNNRLNINPDLAQYLGFNPHFSPGPLITSTWRNTTGSLDDGMSYTWIRYIASNTFSALTLNDSYVVEILSQDLDAYDGQTTERKSILGIIPTSEAPDGSLVYEAQNINKVSIRNASRIGIRGLRCRILDSQLAPVAINGWSVITIGLYDRVNP